MHAWHVHLLLVHVDIARTGKHHRDVSAALRISSTRSLTTPPSYLLVRKAFKENRLYMMAISKTYARISVKSAAYFAGVRLQHIVCGLFLCVNARTRGRLRERCSELGLRIYEWHDDGRRRTTEECTVYTLNITLEVGIRC